MGKGNVRRQRGGNSHSNAASPPPGGVAPGKTATDEAQDRRINWSFALSIASLLVSLASALFAYYSWQAAVRANELTKLAQDRAAGKVRAQFQLIDEKNKDAARMKEFMRKQDGYDRQVFRIESVDELVRWKPYVLDPVQ